MSPVLFVLLLCLRTAQLRHHQGAAPAVSAGSREPFSPERTPLPRPEGSRAPDPKRVARGAGDGISRRRTPDSPRRPDDPSGYFTTRRVPPAAASARPGNDSSPPGLLHPALRGSRWAYVITLLALGLLAAGVVGNLALTCAVWHDLYLQSAWNHVLAGLALCDLLVLLTCLPVVVFHALTSRWLLGDLSCRLVPYVEVTSLGVATFSLCALSIDRFHAATGPAPSPAPRVEPCQSILSKLSVIWVGSMVLAAPELLLWQLRQQAVVPPPLPGDFLMAALRGGSDAFKADVCVREPSADLPEGVFPLVLTYHEARAWWIFGCYLCLPLLFTVACDLVTRHVLAQRLPRKHAGDEAPGRCSASYYSPSASSPSPTKHQLAGERRLRTTVMALAALYGACNLPESVCNIVLAYVPAHASAALPALALPALSLAGQFLLFARCSASPVLLLCLCRSLGQAFMDCCCCCCCQECVQDGARPSSSASTAATTSNVSSPASPSPTSLSPTSLSPSGKDETTKSLLAAKDSPAAVGTPC